MQVFVLCFRVHHCWFCTTTTVLWRRSSTRIFSLLLLPSSTLHLEYLVDSSDYVISLSNTPSSRCSQFSSLSFHEIRFHSKIFQEFSKKNTPIPTVTKMSSRSPRSVIYGLGPIGNVRHCCMCISVISADDVSAEHAACTKSFHLACLKEHALEHLDGSSCCPVCEGPLGNGFRKHSHRILEAAHESQPHTPVPRATDHERTEQSASTFQTSLPDPPSYLQCTFRSPQGLMNLISHGQASVQSLTSEQVLHLRIDPSNKAQALKLSSSLLTEFSRVYYHAPGEPRDGTTVILAHPKVNQAYPGASGGLKGFRDTDTVATSSLDKEERDQLTEMVRTWRSSARTSDPPPSTTVRWAFPPTKCGSGKVDGRKVRFVAGVVYCD